MKQKFFKIFQLLKNLSFSSSFFQNKKILIYDGHTGKYYSNFFKKKQTFFLFTRIYEKGSKVSFFILIWTLFFYFKKYKHFRFSQAYALNVIKLINPKIIITFTDYDTNIYKFKKIFSGKKFVVFQHQLRSKKFLDQRKTIKIKNKDFVDYVCIFGKNVQDYYSQFLNTKFKLLGSIKNNFYTPKNKHSSKSLVFISSFRPHLYSKYFNDKKLKFINRTLIDALNFCNSKKLKLYILSWSSLEQKQFLQLEKKYYEELLGKKNFIFLIKKNFIDSYNISKDFSFFISFNSTFSYELFSRNNKVAIIRNVTPIKNKDILKLDYVDSLTSIKPTGPFWTSKPSKKEIFRILSNLQNADHNKIVKLKKKYISPFMIFDHKCKKNYKFLKNIGFNI